MRITIPRSVKKWAYCKAAKWHPYYTITARSGDDCCETVDAGEVPPLIFEAHCDLCGEELFL